MRFLKNDYLIVLARLTNPDMTPDMTNEQFEAFVRARVCRGCTRYGSTEELWWSCGLNPLGNDGDICPYTDIEKVKGKGGD